MKTITYFYLPLCPYCHQADRMIKELIAENPEFGQVAIEKINERKNRVLANSYDYYYVPSFWIGQEKFHEGVPSKDIIKRVFEAALNSRV